MKSYKYQRAEQGVAVYAPQAARPQNADVRYMKMKSIVHITMALAATVAIIGCTSSKAYFVDRGRDAADIITATIGIGIGAKARVGPFQTGLLAEADGVGLRGGTFPDVSDNRESWFVPNTVDLQLIAVGAESFDSNNEVTSQRHKDFGAESAGPFFHRTKGKWCPSYYTQLDAVVAIGPSIRLGFNPGEFLDFMLGWAKVDIFKDDLETKKKIEQSVAGYPPQGVGSPEP